ncbi:MAG: hypothetical protein Kow00104_19960 [Rhodothalassiaceae bacterium]
MACGSSPQALRQVFQSGLLIMEVVILILHLALALALVGVILIQRSEGGGLGMGGTAGGLMSARGAANLLTRATTYLAIGFLATSLLLAVIAGQGRSSGSIVDETPIEDDAPAQNVPEVPVGG